MVHPGEMGDAHVSSRPVVVVGGASGIGAAVAAECRARGRSVIVWDVRDTADVVCDISDPDQVSAAARRTVSQWGVPDEVSVCAGVGHSGLLLDLEPQEFDRVLAVNTRGPWLVMRALARAMVDGSVAGSFVALSSVSARLVDRNMGAYCASKAALSMLVQVAAAEWADRGLRVNAVAPGVTDTPMLGGAPVGQGWLKRVAGRTALERIGTPDDIAQAVIALHGLEWVTGQVLEVDGGLGLHSPIDSYAEVLRHQQST